MAKSDRKDHGLQSEVIRVRFDPTGKISKARLEQIWQMALIFVQAKSVPSFSGNGMAGTLQEGPSECR